MTTTLPKPFDTALAERGLERWRAEAANAADDTSDDDLGAWAEAYADSAEGRALIDAVCGNSPYLGQILTRELPFVREMVSEGYDAAFAALLRRLEEDCAEERNIDRLMTALRVAKRRAALLIAMADITGAWELEAVTGALSDIAETSVRMAQTTCCAAPRRRGR